ncbi:alpha-2-macroglobulin-like protein 1 [Trichonephila clavipes]|nr:alpha-2-macroglobulin-like protein 1 [Trichonephila clavipes]
MPNELMDFFDEINKRSVIPHGRMFSVMKSVSLKRYIFTRNVWPLKTQFTIAYLTFYGPKVLSPPRTSHFASGAHYNSQTLVHTIFSSPTGSLLDQRLLLHPIVGAPGPYFQHHAWTVTWIVARQGNDGCFPNIGQIIDTGIQGGLKGEKNSGGITAYVASSLLISKYENQTVIAKAMSCLNKNPALRPYETFLYAYAKALAGEKNEAAQKLIDDIKPKNGAEYYKNPNGTLSINIETAAYAILANLQLRNSASEYNEIWFSQVPSQLKIQASGSGCGLIQTSLRYNTNNPPEKMKFYLKGFGECTSPDCDKGKITVDVRYCDFNRFLFPDSHIVVI